MPSSAKVVLSALKLFRRRATRDGFREGLLVGPVTAAERSLTASAYAGLYVSGAISLAVVFGLASIETHSVWFAWLRVTAAVALLVEAALLATNWRSARQLTLWRIQHGRSGILSQSLGRSRITVGFCSAGLQLAGVAWLGAAVFLGLLGLRRLLG